MRGFDKLVEVQRAIDTLTSGENNLGKIGLGQIEDQVGGSVTDSLDISKIANIQNVVRNVTGANLNLGGIANIADCVKNLDDLLIEKVKQEVMGKILETETAQEIVEKLGDISTIAKQGGNLLRQAADLKEKSLAELLVDAKNAGLLDKVKIIKDINDKFGGVVGNLNDVISNLGSFDICNMTNLNQSGSALPPSAKVNTEEPIPLPVFEPLVTIDHEAIETQNRFNDHTFRIKSIIGSEGLPETPGSRSMMVALQDFYYLGQNKAYSGLENDFADVMEQELQRTIATKQDEWPAETLNEYKIRSRSVIDVIETDAEHLRIYRKLKKLDSGEADVGKGYVAIGIGLYGTPDWDWITFLRVIPEERPASLVKYWTDLGYNIEESERKLKASGVKPGTLRFKYTTEGTYDRKLFPGFSAASTSFKGGTRLALQNPDGSPFDPAGLNPRGIITIVDTGDPEQTFDHPHVFVDKLSYDSYKDFNLSSVKVAMVSEGSAENAQYLAAQNQKSRRKRS